MVGLCEHLARHFTGSCMGSAWSSDQSRLYFCQLFLGLDARITWMWASGGHLFELLHLGQGTRLQNPCASPPKTPDIHYDRYVQSQLYGHQKPRKTLRQNGVILVPVHLTQQTFMLVPATHSEHTEQPCVQKQHRGPRKTTSTLLCRFQNAQPDLHMTRTKQAYQHPGTANWSLILASCEASLAPGGMEPRHPWVLL